MKAAAFILVCVAMQAAAQDRPPLLPTRDVDVSYRSSIGEQTFEQRSRFDASAQRMRLDMPTPGFYAIVNYRSHTMAIVSDPDKGVLDVAAPGVGQSGAAALDLNAVRRGPDQVAGLPCTEWEAKDTGGASTLVCFTADGVMLRARRGTQVLALATRVSYGPVDPELFRVPSGYNHVQGRKPQ